MEKLLDTPKRTVYLTTLERPFAFTSPFGEEKFALFLQINARDVSDDERKALSKALVDQGCRYACAVGHKGSTWDDSLDEAAVEEFLDEGEIPDDRFVTTTWREKEPLEDSLRVFRDAAFYDGSRPSKFVIVLLGANPGLETELAKSAEKLFTGAK